MIAPPRLAARFLRVMLAPRDRDTVSGDLLEDYREEVLPSRGKFGADLWYWRQVASFVGLASMDRARAALVADRVVWALAVATVQYALWFFLPERTGEPAEQLSVTFVGLLVACVAGSAIRSRGDALRLLGTCCAWLAPFLALCWMTLRADVFNPVPVVAAFLLLTPLAAFHMARRSDSLRRGVLAAVLVGSTMYLIGALLIVANNSPHPPFGAFPMPPVVATLLGLPGAAFGKRFRRMGQLIPSDPVGVI